MKKISFMVLLIAMAGIVIPVSASAAQVDFSIRFFDKRIYYTDGDPIYVQITITNNTPASYRFKLADERAFSMDFDVRTVSNRQLDAADILTRKRTQYQQIFFREVLVEPGESFSFVEDLRDYANLGQPGSFIVQARLYPELYRSAVSQQLINSAAPNMSIQNAAPSADGTQAGAVQFLESNRLNLNVRPPVMYGSDGTPVEMDVATGAVLVRDKLPPDQVINYLLAARQKSQWEKFFLYLDLESMLSRDPVRKRKWSAESEAGRRVMLKDYREQLQSAVIDGDISTIPIDFTILRTSYTPTDGTVVVQEKFRDGQIISVKRYTYYLAQKDGFWTVVDYAVENLGTE